MKKRTLYRSIKTNDSILTEIFINIHLLYSKDYMKIQLFLKYNLQFFYISTSTKIHEPII